MVGFARSRLCVSARRCAEARARKTCFGFHRVGRGSAPMEAQPAQNFLLLRHRANPKAPLGLRGYGGLCARMFCLTSA